MRIAGLLLSLGLLIHRVHTDVTSASPSSVATNRGTTARTETTAAGSAAGLPGPAAGSADPAAGLPGPATGSAGPAAGSADPAAGLPGPAAGSADPAAGLPDPAAGSAGPATGSADPATGSVDPAAGLPGPATGSGGPATGSPGLTAAVTTAQTTAAATAGATTATTVTPVTRGHHLSAHTITSVRNSPSASITLRPSSAQPAVTSRSPQAAATTATTAAPAAASPTVPIDTAAAAATDSTSAQPATAAAASKETPGTTKPPVLTTEQTQRADQSHVTKMFGQTTAAQQRPVTPSATTPDTNNAETKTAARKAPSPPGATSPTWTTRTNLPDTSSTKVSTSTESQRGTIFLKTTASKAVPTAAQSKIFQYSLNSKHEPDQDQGLVELCKRLVVNLQDGNCSITWRREKEKVQLECVQINGKVKTSLATQLYEEITKEPSDNKTLIAILASSGALLVMIFILAVCASRHRRPYADHQQQHLTEDQPTVENGYHDNPTLEVMEVAPEMQEKKVGLNGEFNDSWMVPMDNLLKEELPDEEDTHL